MKTLFLLRHAKSGWKDSDLRDFDRPLTTRGKRAAAVIGRYLRKHEITPDLVISSPAERARETVEIVLASSRLSVEPRYDERIYAAHPGRLLEVISQLDEQAESALLVGHNPGFEELVTHLTGNTLRMPTAALAQIGLDIDKWRQIRTGTGQLQRMTKPKELPD
jgi:phosphohistidine phosphatase